MEVKQKLSFAEMGLTRVSIREEVGTSGLIARSWTFIPYLRATHEGWQKEVVVCGSVFCKYSLSS